MSYNSGIESRKVAWKILGKTRTFAKEALDASFASHSLKSEDSSLIMELVYGVIRHSLTLRHIIQFFSRHVPKEEPLCFALMMGLYQMLFMDRIPCYAALDTTIELLKTQGYASQAKYANALLRKVQRSCRRIETSEEKENRLCVKPGTTWEFDYPLFPDPKQDLISHWALVYSYPILLVKRWQAQWGNEVTKTLLHNGNQTPAIYLRVRPETNLENLLQTFREKQVEFSLFQGLIELKKAGEIAQLPGYREKMWRVTGPTPVKVVQCLSPQPGEKILDLCAAPGGKAVHIADFMQGKGEIVCCDISSQRLEKLSQTVKELQIPNIQIHCQDGTCLPSQYWEKFDRVLTDVPCSNTGVLAKRPEARWRFNKKNLTHLSELQSKLLFSASKAVKPGGILLYSTCSLEPEENWNKIEDFCKKNPDFEFEEGEYCLPFLPHLDGGTFFKLRKQK